MNRTHVFRILNEMIFFGKVQNRLEENKSSRVSDECVENNRTPIILQIRSIVKSGWLHLFGEGNLKIKRDKKL